ncbi:MAG: RNA polymerase sigma factor [Planctomycetota bacterium]
MADKAWRQRKGNWLRLLVSGDHDAFREFVNQYQQTVFLCCRTLGLNETEAEDVASETFLTVYEKIGTYNGKSKLSTWLWKVAYYKGVNYLRKNGRHKELLNGLDEQLADARIAHVAAAFESKEQADAVWQAVGRLPKLWALTIVLFYRQEKSIKEIAKIMNKRQNTVKTYLFRGRKRLKERLSNVIAEDFDVR